VFGDLGQVYEDITRMEAFLKEMHFDKIIVDKDPDYGSVESHMGEIKKLLRANYATK